MSRRITRNKQSVAGPSVSATTLLAVPAALLDNIAFRAVQLGAGDALSLTCRAFSKANLLHAPSCEIAVVKATDSVPNAHFSSAFWCVCLQATTSKSSTLLYSSYSHTSPS
ncbi:hypothetical protein HaLaN_22768 [Haematococcus lacustris]|uniref:Uncharacterized protein n=1 Tax=Haematococcus lacustris TaxID=44745 RepID=A0A6A0A0P2_HAELA|nr:hypothetical protein HaLaN_22768 [Haematococcus lacustris]